MNLKKNFLTYIRQILFTTRPKKKKNVKKKSQALLKKIGNKYGSSKLHKVQDKVNEVKSTLNDGITVALENVESIETVEASAAILEKEAHKFKKEAKVVKIEAKKKYWLSNTYLAILVFIVIIIIVIIICVQPGLCAIE